LKGKQGYKMLEIPLHGGGVVAYQADRGKPAPA